MISRHSSKIWHLLRQRQAIVTYTLSPTMDLIVVCQTILSSAKKEQINKFPAVNLLKMMRHQKRTL